MDDRVATGASVQTASRLTIRRFVGGPMLTACYLITDPNRESILIDAPRDAWHAAIGAAEKAGAPVSLLIATHGHWDHITQARELQLQGVPVAGHAADNTLFADPMGQRDALPFVIEPIVLDREFADGERIPIGLSEIAVLHTPGHTPGSTSLWLPGQDVLFTGDTVLKGGAGYLRRPECDAWALASSVHRIAMLPESTVLYPGHGAPTSIAEEEWLSTSADRESLISGWKSGAGRWTPRA